MSKTSENPDGIEGYQVNGPITKRLLATRGNKGWNPPRSSDREVTRQPTEGFRVTGRGKLQGK